MKKTLLILFFITLTFNVSAQIFETGTINFNQNLSADITIDQSTTTLTITVPDNIWFAVGFGGSTMSSGADVFRSNGTEIFDARTTARRLPPVDAQQDWTLVSNMVSNSTRTMVVTRPNDTGDSNDFVFNPNAGSLTMIWAHGTSTNFAFHGGNRGATTAAVTLNTPEANRLSFDLFPNPAAERLTIQLPSGSNSATVQLFDYVGRLALTQDISLGNENVNVSNLNSGVYLLRVMSNDKIGTQKFVKN